MTIGGAVAIAFLGVMVVLVLRGIRGHRRSGDRSDAPGSVGESNLGASGD